MNELLSGYERFFRLLRRDQEEKYETYANTALNQLFATSQAFFGQITGVTEQGDFILRFENGNTPRLKVPMEFCILRKKAFALLGENIGQWNWSSVKFRENADIHTKFSSILPTYLLRDKVSIGCSRVDIEMAESLRKYIADKVELRFIMLETLPPTEMLMYLAEYIRKNPTDKNLMLKPWRTYDEWVPAELKSSDNVARKIQDILNEEKICVLQGPPGTGKSYTLGEIISDVTAKGMSVCVTTQNNDSLTSLVSQKSILPLITRNGYISKTVLTSDEKKKHPFLKSAEKNLTVPKGGLILSTYYSLSRIIIESDEPLYDLIIIEEASQAYLTIIASFIKLGVKCLIVGDPMQLPPVVEIINPNDYLGIDIDTQANGMMTFIRSVDVPSIRMTTSFRLTNRSAEQTKVFYNNNLVSVQKDALEFDIPSDMSKFFPKNGGTIIYNTHGSSGGDCSNEAKLIIQRIVSLFYDKYPNRSLAILSPYINATKILQKEFGGGNIYTKIDTINRIQGMTVDYTIFYVPQRNYDFAFSENLFNVATSRSRSTTLIITDMPIDLIPIKSNKVKEFISHCDIVEL